jgi:mannose-1-phosphate guanylyltransferase / mannose-6-phosphate isomerase
MSDRPSTSMYAAILAGGSGQRFWPLSRELNPKQLLSVFGTESLIAQAVHRILPFTVSGAASVRIVTNERLFDELRNHLTAQDDVALHNVGYLLEPAARNTAPAIALAAAALEAEDPDAIMAVLPSDHLLEDSQVWADSLESASSLARDGYLVTIGITPTRPETGYGYIRSGAALSEHDRGTASALKAAEFVEKPDHERAVAFVEGGEHFWNAGIFVMGATTLLDELASASDDGARIVDVCRWLAARPRDTWTDEDARERFEALPSVSIDKAVMEISSRVAVIRAPLHWSDVGSLLSLEDVAEPDERGVVRVGRGVDIDSSNSIVYSTDRLVATLGIEDLVVVDTSDATLVCRKDRVQDVRLVVEALKAAGAEEVTQPKVSMRPWGSWTSLLKTDYSQIKLLEVKPGMKLSLQRHHHRAEHWIVVAGTAVVTRDDEAVEVHVNESIFIPMGTTHRLENCGKVQLKVIEVQVGEYLGEDDIVRLEDDWDREKK